MLLIDNFLFNGDLIVKLRLKYLYPYVDRFYICEKRYTYQGEKKEKLYIEIYSEWFEEYKNKCIFIIDEEKPFPSSWETEKAHRNYSAKYILKDYPKESFLLLCADVDEIPDIHLLHKKKEELYRFCMNGSISLKQKMYYYNLNWYIHDWFHPFIINDIIFKENYDIDGYRGKKGKIAGCLECGWHMSYFMEKKDILRKIESFSHTEYNNSEYKNDEFINDCILYGQDLYKRDWIPHFTRENPYKMNYPKDIIEFHNEILKIQYKNIID